MGVQAPNRINAKSFGSSGRTRTYNPSVNSYQSARLKEKASPKSINEEVGFLLRILADQGDALRGRLRRRKQLKLKVRETVGRAFSPEEKAQLYEQALTRRSPAIYPALVLALNCGLGDKELRELQWGRVPF